MDKKMTWVEAGLMLAVFAATFALIYMTAAFYYPGDKHGDTATWFGAAGAFLAFGGTIWIATNQTRHSDALAMRVARLVAAGMTLRLLHAESVMQKIADRMAEMAVVDENLTAYILLAGDIDKIDLWSMDEIIHLAPLPDIAIQLAESRGQILTTQRILQKLIERSDVKTSEGRKAFALSCKKPMQITIDKISTSITRCQAETDALHIRNNGMQGA